VIIQLLKEKVHLIQDVSSVELVVSTIDDLVRKSDLILTGMDIDGLQIYDRYEEIIAQNLLNIRMITLEAKSKGELENELMAQLGDYLSRAIPALEELISELYKSVNENTWNTFLDFVEGTSWIIKLLEFIDPSRLPAVVSPLNENLLELNSAVEKQDTILMADILMYEIKPLYEEVLSHLSKQ
jgi:hypothetical protein